MTSETVIQGWGSLALLQRYGRRSTQTVTGDVEGDHDLRLSLSLLCNPAYLVVSLFRIDDLMDLIYPGNSHPSGMKRLCHIVPFFLLFLLPTLLLAQREDEIWYFGQYAGIDFRSGSPVALTNSAMNQNEGTAVMSDRHTGNLLLYTDGRTVWNRNHQVMPGGTGLFGSMTSTQSAIIAPFPRDSTRFYIFTVNAGLYGRRISPTPSGAHYSIVDMKLNGGLGGITQKNVPIYAPAAEKMVVARHCNGRSYWLLLHDENGQRFVAFEISPSGVSRDTVVSDVGSVHGIDDEASIGYMRLSPSLKKLAVATSRLSVVDVLDFDNRTGRVSNPVTIRVSAVRSNPMNVTYGVCFSPDETKLYVSGDDFDYLVQYDISSGVAATIERSRYVLHEIDSYRTGAIQIGPDNRLYVATGSGTDPWLGVIRNPNLAGAACGFDLRAIPLGGRSAVIGLPNFVDGAYDTRFDICKPPTAVFSISDTSICPGTCVTFQDASFDDPVQWEWSFGGANPSSSTARNPGSVCYPNPGSYEVRLVVLNANGSDTMRRTVHVRPFPQISVSPDTLICAGGGTARLRVRGTPDVVGYRWSPSATLSCTDCTDPIATPTDPVTTYTVVATTIDGCESSASVTVRTAPLLAVDAGRDTAICLGSSVTLRASGGSRYQWQQDSTLPCTTCATAVVTPQVTTVYRLVGYDASGCFGVDSVTVRVVPPPTITLSDVASLCSGDSIRLETAGTGTFTWSPAAGLSCTSCASPMAAPKSTTTYYLTAVSELGELGCRTVDSITIVVDQAPRLVRAHIDDDYGVYPGVELVVPVRLDDPLDLARVTTFEFTLTYDPGMLQLQKMILDSVLLDGWQVFSSSSDPGAGTYTAQLVSFPPRPLTGVGNLVHLKFRSFIGTARTSPLAFDIDIANTVCTRIETTPGLVRLDSVCGLDFRLIEGSTSKYALEAVMPHPISDRAEFRFSLGLDGPTTLEVFDAMGERVALVVDGLLQPGSYAVVWDAVDRAQGLYYYRLRSGDWSQTGRMILRR